MKARIISLHNSNNLKYSPHIIQYKYWWSLWWKDIDGRDTNDGWFDYPVLSSYKKAEKYLKYYFKSKYLQLIKNGNVYKFIR